MCVELHKALNISCTISKRLPARLGSTFTSLWPPHIADTAAHLDTQVGCALVALGQFVHARGAIIFGWGNENPGGSSSLNLGQLYFGVGNLSDTLVQFDTHFHI